MESIFGKSFDVIWPEKQLAISEDGLKFLNECRNVEKPANITLQEICKKSAEFKIKFPIDTCRILSQPKSRYADIQKQIDSVYPLIHERVLFLYIRFLEHKVKFGNRIEKEIYDGMSVCEFINRLLYKRCCSFVGPMDKYLLKTGEMGVHGFMSIGSLSEVKPKILQDCLSYDEMKLSAFLSVSSFTEFINDGNRFNCGVIEENKSLIETSGVVIGVIGGRFQNIGNMEYQDIVISKKQNIAENGYGSKIKKTKNTKKPELNVRIDYRQMWNDFYEEEDFLYSKKLPEKDRQRFDNETADIFDNLVMKKRYTITFDTLLLDGNARALSVGKMAYIHVVGIGLGVWRKTSQQEAIFLETFSQRLKTLLPVLKNVSHVHFSWFKLKECLDLKDNGFLTCSTHPDGGIRVLISNRDPAAKLKIPDSENCLIIESYAWDSNALPGNEFWMGSLSSSGDPAAVCSTLIGELHNGFINDVKVNGRNVHIASAKNGILHIRDYADQYFSG